MTEVSADEKIRGKKKGRAGASAAVVWCLEGGTLKRRNLDCLPNFPRTRNGHMDVSCREGEAWEIAAGLHLGGASPVVLIQCTGLFESGDALRNVLHDWKLPIFSIIGYRSYLSQDTLPGDTSLVFTEPVLSAWNIDYKL